MRTAVYRNLNKNCWSITENGLVIKHCNFFVLKDCDFKVGEKSRQRVIREKKKNVHARVYGKKTEFTKEIKKMKCVRISYNPYKSGNFFQIKDNKPIYKAKYVVFDGSECYAVKDIL